jgi:DnaD and phage-associated domain
MKITLNYGTGVISLPDAIVGEYMNRASKTDLCVILAVASMQREDVTEKEIASLLKITAADVRSSLSFWRGAGVINCGDAPPEKAQITIDTDAADTPTEKTATKTDSPPKDETKKSAQKTLEQANVVPTYTSEQIADFFKNNKSMKELLNECQQTFGKMFNAAESSAVMMMKDYLGLDSDYILLLIAHCASEGKKSIRALERMAITLHDTGIDTYAALEEHLNSRNLVKEAEPQIRKLFGMGRRALTANERKFFAKWLGEFGYGMDIIECAYEITIARTKEPSVEYTNAILENWYKNELTDLDAISAFNESRKKDKKSGSSSFDNDDFFEKALKRSYEDN